MKTFNVSGIDRRGYVTEKSIFATDINSLDVSMFWHVSTIEEIKND